jgi:hypothetical protein
MDPKAEITKKEKVRPCDLNWVSHGTCKYI